jgi:hypothetical protein
VLITSRGVAAGASTPYQTTTSTPFTPDSLSVGTSGICAARFVPAFASARSRFDFTCDEIAGMLAKVISTSPPRSAVSEGALPL